MPCQGGGPRHGAGGSRGWVHAGAWRVELACGRWAVGSARAGGAGGATGVQRWRPHGVRNGHRGARRQAWAGKACRPRRGLAAGAPQTEVWGASGPNIALEPTPNSLRSFLATALGRGSPRALDGKPNPDLFASFFRLSRLLMWVPLRGF